jgi:hypothetical protein
LSFGDKRMEGIMHILFFGGRLSRALPAPTGEGMICGSGRNELGGQFISLADLNFRQSSFSFENFATRNTLLWAAKNLMGLARGVGSGWHCMIAAYVATDCAAFAFARVLGRPA